MEWTPEAIDALRAGWEAGHSAKRIGAAMGCSRNCVIGKAHRLGLPSRDSPIVKIDGLTDEERAERRRAQDAKRRARHEARRKALGLTYVRKRGQSQNGTLPTRPHLAKLPAPILAERPWRPEPEPRTYHPITHRACQWIAGEPTADDSCKCLGPSVGGAYCEEHYARAFDRRQTAESKAKRGEYEPREVA